MFENPAMLRVHFKEQHSDPICLACGLHFDHDKLLRLHMEHYHKVGGKGTKKDMMAFCEELSVKMAPPTDDVTATLVPTPAGQSSPRGVHASPESEGGSAEEECEVEQSNGVVRTVEGAVDRDTGPRKAVEADTAKKDDEIGSPKRQTEIRDTLERAGIPEERASPTLSPLPVTVHELNGERGEVVHGQGAFHPERNHKIEPSAFLPLRDIKAEVTSGMIELKAEITSGMIELKTTTDSARASVDAEERHLQSQRPSVIATVSCSERTGSRSTTEDVWDFNTRPVQARVPFLKHESRSDSQGPSLKDDTSDERKLWEEEGQTFEQGKLYARRPAPRCNRCQQWFPSKMEYLHHLISHQDADGQSVGSFEGASDQEEPGSESDTQSADSDEPKRQGYREYKRWSVPDIRRPVTSSSGYFPEVQVLKRHSVPDIRPHPIPSDSTGPLNRGLYGTVACSECKDVFFDSRSCKIHIEKRHMKPKCSQCGLRFDHKNLLKIHMNSYHSPNPVLQCYHCGLQFKERSKFVSHVTSHETQTVSPDAKTLVRGNDLWARNLRGKLRREKLANRPLHTESEPTNSRHDEERVVESPRKERVSPVHIKTEVDNEVGEPQRTHREDRRETRTRIFMPQFRDARYKDRGVDVGYSRSQGYPSPEREKSPEGYSRLEPLPEKHGVRVNGLVKASEQVSTVVTDREQQGDRRGIAQVPKPTAEESKTESRFGRPPPLIPVRQLQTKTENFTNERSSVTGGQMSPCSLHSRPLSSAIPVPVVPRLSSSYSPWAHAKEPSGTSPERPQDKHMLEIRPFTKEALLNSLCLRRRASAPELTGLYRPKMVRPAESSNPVVAEEPSGEPNNEKDAPVSEANSPGPLSGAASFRARQMAMSYQPRRSQPGDFTCQRCGIFFGHKKLLKIHLDSYHGNSQSLQCLHCNSSFNDRSQFLDHLMAHQDKGVILTKETGEVFQRRKRSAPEIPLRSSAAHLESLYHRAIMGAKKARVESIFNSADNESTMSEELPSPGSTSPRSDEDLPCPSRGEARVREGDEEAANFCFVCGKSFESGKQLEQHISSHAILNEDGMYCCSLCQKTFDHHRKLEMHTRSHTGFKPHKCEFCGRCFPYYSSYYYHRMTHTDYRPHKCEECGKGFIQARYLRSHLKSHKESEGAAEREGGELGLEQIEKIPISTPGLVQIKIELNNHQQQSTAGSISNCEKNGADRDSKQTSEEKSGGGKKNSDGTSGRDSEKWVVKNGVARETEREQMIGGATKVEEKDLRSATVPKTTPEEAKVSRNEGSRVVVGMQSLQMLSGEATVTVTTKPEKHYQCKHCQKRFSSYSSLYVHTRLHTGLRPYTCKYCDKTFTHASGMKRHVRCHTGERPYPCTYCPSAFADRGALRSHIRTHTGERPYKCDLCEKRFTQSSSLRVHKKTVHLQK